MIIDEIVLARAKSVEEAVHEVFEMAKKNMAHPGDLMLIHQQGYFSNLAPTTPMIGLGLLGHAYLSQRKYISWYRKQFHIAMPEADYDALIRADAEHASNDQASTHMEANIYLGFWESDYFQKVLYQLGRLVTGQPYDWHRVTPTETIVSVESSIARFKKACPRFFGILNSNYDAEIRNDIAHSLFFADVDGICFVKENSDDRRAFEDAHDWRYRFATTLLVYNAINKEFAEYAKKLVAESSPPHDLDIRVIYSDGHEEMKPISPRDEAKPESWVWSSNQALSGMR